MKAKKCCGVASPAAAGPSVEQAADALLSAALAYVRGLAVGAPAGDPVVICYDAFVHTCWSLLDDRVPAWRILNYFSGEDLAPDACDWLILADDVMLELAERGLLSYVEDPRSYAVILLDEASERNVAS